MMEKLRWKLHPAETCLRAVGAGPRSSDLHDGEKRYAVVYPIGGGWRAPLTGWYWVAGWDSGVPHENTCYRPCVTVEQAKAEAMAYVKAHLAKAATCSSASSAKDH